MPLPSITHIQSVLAATIRRYPAEMVIAAAGTVGSVVLFALLDAPGNSVYEKTLLRTVLCCVLSMSAVLALTTLQEAGVVRKALYWPLVVGVVLLLYWYTDHTISAESESQYIAACIAVHLLVAISAVWKRNQDEFWEFNKTVFLRLVAAGIFTGVLLAGTLSAIVSLNVLFDVDVAKWVYASNVILFVGLFNTVHVLSGVPTQSPIQPFPKVLLSFTQYVLLPLVALFLVILYAYVGKVIFFTDLDGAVAGYVLAVAVIGILAFLLVYPLQSSTEHRWVSLFARWFAVAMLPLTAMLWVAIGVRVGQYGITEDRYSVIALATSLSVITLYLSIRKKPDIRLIPVVLLVVACVAAFGPLNVRSVSIRSQLERATEMLNQLGIVAQNKVQRGAATALLQDRREELESCIRYVVFHTDSTTLREWTSTLADSSPDNVDYYAILSWLALYSPYETDHRDERVSLRMNQSLAPQNIWVGNGSVQPFDFGGYYSDQPIQHTFYEEGQWQLRFDTAKYKTISIRSPKGNDADIDLSQDLVETNFSRSDSLPRGHYSYAVSLDGKMVRIVFNYFRGEIQSRKWKSVNADGVIIVERPRR